MAISVCDSALLLGYSRELSTLGAGDIREVAADMELTPECAEGGTEPGEASAKQPRKGRRRGLLGLFR